MKRISLLSLLIMSAVMALLAGCAYHGTGWNPQKRTVTLYTPTVVEIPDEYTYVGSMRARVEGTGDVATIIPYDSFDTKVFTANGKVLLAQRLIKDDRYYKFRFLGGEKADVWGVTWRTAVYVYDRAVPHGEFAQYADYLAGAGVRLPQKVHVRILDRLASDFIVLRVVTLSYGDGADETTGLQPLPLFRSMYDQEQNFERGERWPAQ